jgi:hypothetical protein
LWQTTLQCRGFNRNNSWQSALKFIILTLAIRVTIIFFMAIRSTLVPAIVHQKSPCSRQRIFLGHSFTSAKPIQGRLLIA